MLHLWLLLISRCLLFFTNKGHNVSMHTYALSKLSLIIPSIVFTSSADIYIVSHSIIKRIFPLTLTWFTHALSSTEQAIVDILPDSLYTEFRTSMVSGKSRLYQVNNALSMRYALVSSPQAIFTTVQSVFLEIKSPTSSSNTRFRDSTKQKTAETPRSQRFLI